MNAAMRKIGALCQKDFVDMFKNPSMLVCLLMPIAFAALFRYMLGDVGVATVGKSPQDYSSVIGNTLNTFELSSSLCMAIVMVVSMAVVYGIAEEKEKHTLRTLMLANVSAGQIIVSRAVISLVMMLVVATACFFIADVADVELLVPYLALGVLGALPIILLSLVLGLAARDQMTAGLYAVPVILIALAPMFGAYGEPISEVVAYLPTGGMNKLVELMMQGNLMTSDALLPLAVTLVWTVVCAILFISLFKRLTRDN